MARRRGDSNGLAIGGIVAALVVAAAGVVAAITYDDSSDSASTSTTTTTTVVHSSTTSSTTSTSSTTVPSSSTTVPGASSTTTTAPASTTTTVHSSTTTTVPPTTTVAVPTPEQAANGLWAAYRANDKAKAERFATPTVVNFLFDTYPYQPPDGAFQGCQPSGSLFVCKYIQPTQTTDMTVQKNPDTGSYIVVVVDVTKSG